jgi:hypothetical protein
MKFLGSIAWDRVIALGIVCAYVVVHAGWQGLVATLAFFYLLLAVSDVRLV